MATDTLDVSGGTLTGIDTLDVSGQTTWSGGTMSGPGTTNANGGLILGGTAVTTYYRMFLDGRTFNNAGAARFQRSSTGDGYDSLLYLSSDALFDNLATGSFTFTDDNTSVNDNGGSPDGGTFRNDGALIKHGADGSSAINTGISFEDLGTATLAVSSGTLALRGGGTVSSTSAVQVAAGATLDFGGGSFAVSAGITGTGSGAVRFSDATVDLSGAYAVAGTTSVVAGTFSDNSPTRREHRDTHRDRRKLVRHGHAQRVGTDDLVGRGDGGDGHHQCQRRVDPRRHGRHHLLSHVPGCPHLQQRRLRPVPAHATGDGYDSLLYLSSDALFDNLATGSFTFTDDNTSINDNGGSPDGGTFRNDGTLIKHGTDGSSAINAGITFEDSGVATLAVSSGTLSLRGGGTIFLHRRRPGRRRRHARLRRRDLAVSAGITGTGSGTVRFSGATVDLSGAYAVAGATSVVAGTFNDNAPTAASTGTLIETGGIFSGTGTFNVSGQTTWSGGTISGAGTTNANGGLILGGTAVTTYYRMFLDGRTFNNAGAALFQRSATGDGYDSLLYLSSDALFDNLATGSFTFTDDNTSVNDNGGSPDGGTFRNDGALIKHGADGSSAINTGITFTNTGTIEAAFGTLSIKGTFSNFASATHTLTGGSFIVSATLQFTGADIVTNAAAITLSRTASRIVDDGNLDAMRNFAINTADGVSARSWGDATSRLPVPSAMPAK